MRRPAATDLLVVEPKGFLDWFHTNLDPKLRILSLVFKVHLGRQLLNALSPGLQLRSALWVGKHAMRCYMIQHIASKYGLDCYTAYSLGRYI